MEWLKAHPAPVGHAKSDRDAVVYRATKWRLQDRLTEKDVVRLILAYKTGMAAQELAERYGINMKSVRKLLQKNDVKKRAWYDFT